MYYICIIVGLTYIHMHKALCVRAIEMFHCVRIQGNFYGKRNALGFEAILPHWSSGAISACLQFLFESRQEFLIHSAQIHCSRTDLEARSTKTFAAR